MRALIAVALVLSAAACGAPMPEAGSQSAELYLARCGTCHVPYRPGLLTPKMWDAMVQRMEIEMRRRGVALGGEEKSAILAYLHRNAAKP